MLRDFFMPCIRMINKTYVPTSGARWFGLEHEEKKLEELGREELLEYLRQLAEWKNNDVVKLAFLEGEEAERVDTLDLTGVSELKRNANGTFEAKFVDRVRVLTMLRELLDERQDGALADFLDGLCLPQDGGKG